MPISIFAANKRTGFVPVGDFGFMSASDRKTLLEIAAKARARLMESGAWDNEIEAEKEVSARVKQALDESD